LLRAGKRTARVSHRSKFARLSDRYELPHLLNQRRLFGCGAEVGVARGVFSEALLSGWQGRHLISIDPWAAATADEYRDTGNLEQPRHDEYYEDAVRRLAVFGSRSSLWRMTGSDGAARIPHHSLDFVYIDARHDYESVRADLREWFEKLRPGGIIAGHDYVDGDTEEGGFGVKKAVDEFFSALDLPVGSTFADPHSPTWWVLVLAGLVLLSGKTTASSAGRKSGWSSDSSGDDLTGIADHLGCHRTRPTGRTATMSLSAFPNDF
jgi:Methyltransferase domain